MSNRGFLSLLVIVVVLILGSSSFYIVTEYERAVVLRFGRFVGASDECGAVLNLTIGHGDDDTVGRSQNIRAGAVEVCGKP